jgi:hypothetical protein
LFNCIQRDPDSLVFIRPDRDLKEFAGSVIKVSDFENWSHKISHGDFAIKKDCPIVVAEPVGIRSEWRLFVVNGRVVAGSQYKKDDKLCLDNLVPEQVISFANDCISIWNPMPVFVIDIGQSASNLYIIELGCFNSAGFYAADIKTIMKAVTELVEQ